MLTLGSLFDGIGGWQLAAQHAGVEPIWSSEIEPFPCAVTAKHFPNVVQLGDITKLDGTKLWPVDIICAGSPCQDLSVAGKQEGLKGERSGLFRDAIRLVRDMRRASRGRYPRFFVWENVPGAFSSNKGLDFRAVLEEIGQTSIPMPEGGKWANAGLAELPTCDIAWRVLDAQYWGVPQRRRRIFLVVDFAAERRCAGQVLFEWQSLPRNIEESGEAREGAAAGTESGVGGASVVRMRAGCAGGGKGPLVSRERSLTLAANTNDQVLFTGNCLTPWDVQSKQIYREDGIDPCLSGADGSGRQPIVAAGFKAGAGADAGGLGYQVEQMPTLTSAESGTQRPTVAVYGVGCDNGIAGTLDASYYKGQGERQGTERTAIAVYQNHVRVQRTMRRLTPTECERLQGLPDGYTLIDDKTCSDTARYKALGNGMAQPCADYVIRRIVEGCNVGKKETDGGTD